MEKKSNYFRHVDKCTTEPVQGKVSGTVPKWLEGVMIRNGPGIQQIGPDHYKHLFDGLSVLHRFEIKNGQVTYQNRALESDNLKKNTEHQRIIVGSFGTRGITDPCKSMFDRFKSTFVPGGDSMGSDDCNVNVAFYGDQLYAMTETAFVRRVDPDTLKSIGSKVYLTDHITVNHATAHPHVLQDGTVLNMGNNYKHKKGPHYCIIQVPPSYESDETSFKNAKIIAEIPMRWKMYPCYYHSFGMTSNSIVFVEQPYCISIPKIMTSHLLSNSFNDCITWHPSQKTRIHIVPMETGIAEALVYETDNLFTFHHINAFEEDGNIIMDVAAYDDADWVHELVVDHKKNGKSLELRGASARRYVLPTNITKDTKPGVDLVNLENCNAKAKLRAGTDGKIVDVKPHKFTDWFEFPRINYKHNGKKYNFFYGAEGSPQRREESPFPEADIISKYDIEAGKKISWTGKRILASEPIFVVNTELENPEEDDGVILSALLHIEDLTLVTLLILNAKDLSEIAKVEFKAEGPVSATFHGLWANSSKKLHAY